MVSIHHYMVIIIQHADVFDGMFDRAGWMMWISLLSGLALVLCFGSSINCFNVREMLPKNDWLDRVVNLSRGECLWWDVDRIQVGDVSQIIDLTPRHTPRLRGTQAVLVPKQLRFMALKLDPRCIKLREALQKVSKLPLVFKVELDYADCGAPSRSASDIIQSILKDFASKFQGAFSYYVKLSEVSDFEHVAINCAGCLVWEPLLSSSEDDRYRCEFPNQFCTNAERLVWLLEDASHEEPLFADAEANPLRIWEIFVAANIQKECFCTLASYEQLQQCKCGQKLVESSMTTKLWNTVVSRFKAAELHLAKHKMIDSDLGSQLEDFKQKLIRFSDRSKHCLLSTEFKEEYFCSESCTGCEKSLWGLKDVWIVDRDTTFRTRRQKRHQQFSDNTDWRRRSRHAFKFLNEDTFGRKPLEEDEEDTVVRKRFGPLPEVKKFQRSCWDLTEKMSDLTAAASKIANLLPSPVSSEDAESSQESSPGSWVNVVKSPSSIASTSKKEHCIKVREALQKFSELRILIGMERLYGECSWDTRSDSEIIRPILTKFVSNFEATWPSVETTWPNDPYCVPLSQAADFEAVGISWAESMVWKPLRSSCEDAGCCKETSSLCSIAERLVWLLEDASHEEPLFADAAANPLRIWEIFVASNIQKECFCTVAICENRSTRVQKSSLTTKLWNIIVSRFKAAQLQLEENKMIDSDLGSQLQDFRQILSDLRDHMQNTWCVGRLPEKMSDLTAAASKIANSLPAPDPSEDAESSQGSSSGSGVSTGDQADQETFNFHPDESASQVGDGSALSDSCTLVSAVGGQHCFLPCYLFRVPGQVEETSFISGKDTGEENIVDDDEE